jgi:uncharacterized membrane protein YobD (UPF0266 family)
MAMDISDKEYAEIEQLIASEESVVGIDAKKTHILIIHMLRDLSEKVERLENRISELERQS